MKKKHSQIVVRLTCETEKKLKKLANKAELTKAAWLRTLILKELESSK